MTFLINPPKPAAVQVDEQGAPAHLDAYPLVGDLRPVQRWLAEVDWWSRPVSLRSLERAGVIETRPNPAGRGSTYHLTESDRQLAGVIKELGIWGQQWLELSPEHLDPDFLMWRVFKHLELNRLPLRRRVVRFEFEGLSRRYWLVLQREDPDLCHSDPGFGDDLVVREPRSGGAALPRSAVSVRRSAPGSDPTRGFTRAGPQPERLARSRTFILTVGSTVDVIAYAFMEIRPAEAGSCQLGTRIAELHTLSVLPEQRGAHIGSELLSAVRRELADRGVKHMLIGVIATNSDAFRFYERHEFRPFMTTLIGHV